MIDVTTFLLVVSIFLSKYVYRGEKVYTVVGFGQECLTFAQPALIFPEETQRSLMSQTKPKINTTRLVLTKIREGDYLHAGEEEAIDMVLKKVLTLDRKLPAKAALDVGSGLGGTANYFYQQGFKDIQGIDLDPAAIAYTKVKYPHISFTESNALELDKLYPSPSFSLIYLFNVIYAIQDKATLIKKLSALTVQNGILVLFDYAEGKRRTDFPIIDKENTAIYPLQIDDIKKDLDAAGWKIIDINDLTQNYIVWYQGLVRKINNPSSQVVSEFSQAELSQVNKMYSYLLDLLEKGDLGGVVIYATKK